MVTIEGRLVKLQSLPPLISYFTIEVSEFMGLRTKTYECALENPDPQFLRQFALNCKVRAQITKNVIQGYELHNIIDIRRV